MRCRFFTIIMLIVLLTSFIANAQNSILHRLKDKPQSTKLHQEAFAFGLSQFYQSNHDTLSQLVEVLSQMSNSPKSGSFKSQLKYHSLFFSGLRFVVLQNAKKAQPYLLNAITGYENQDLYPFLFSAYSAYALVCRLARQDTLENIYNKKALFSAITHGDSARIAKALNNIGTWFADRNNYDSAYNYLISASKYTLKHGDSRSKVQLIGNLIITTTSLNKFNEAYQYIQLGVPLADELNEYDARISMRLSLANYYIDSKAFKKALKLLYEIRPLIKKERLDHLLTLHTLRNGVFRSLNMHDSAHQAYTDLYYLNEQMIRSNANAQFAELNIKYETIKKEKENLSLKAANKSQQFLIYISILIILVLAVIALLINYKKQLSQKLAESNENKRLIAEERAKNAHISLENEQLKFNATQSELQQMHIIMTAKNNTLFQLKTLLQENANTNPSQLRGDLVRLAAQIEEDIRNENSCTDITNSSIYENFVAKLSKVHPNLSKNDLRLCVYIKLGFSSAEIATFLNITEKSVTVRRSRVRAKLQLEEGTKFKEFLDAI